MFKKRSKRKEKEAKPESDVEVISMMKTKFDDTKAIIEVSPELKWGEIYKIIRDQNIPYVSIEEMFLYQNIKMWGITKSTTHPKLFPYLEVIGWILP